MEESLMEVLPRLEKRTHYLATFANIATLLGLLGTIIGSDYERSPLYPTPTRLKKRICSRPVSRLR